MPIPTKPFIATNQLERELGRITSEQKKQVTEVLRTFMSKVREIRKGDCEARVSCETCAFSPKTDSWPGFAPTAYGVMKSIRDMIPFLCHEDSPDWRKNVIDPENLVVCKGFESVVLMDPIKAADATIEAMVAIARIVPEMKPQPPERR